MTISCLPISAAEDKNKQTTWPQDHSIFWFKWVIVFMKHQIVLKIPAFLEYIRIQHNTFLTLKM